MHCPAFIHSPWYRLARLRPLPQALIKILLFGLILFAVCFPHPGRFLKQLRHYRHVDSLIQTDFKGLDSINAAIDSLLAGDSSTQRELKIIQWYIYHKIRYQNDWDLWTNVDYWPTAAETWQTGAEDCDGQAILAVSILRSRGYTKARLAGNMLHIWAVVDSIPLMGAMEEETVRREEGRIKIKFPSLNLALRSFGYTIEHFPAIRILIVSFSLLLLCFHPATRWRYFGISAILLPCGLFLMKDWAGDLEYITVARLNFDFIMGMLLVLAGLLLAAFSKSISAQPNKGKDSDDAL